MYPWSVDAREAIKDESDIDVSLIEETDEIKVFLHHERLYFVIATKGLGKSLLLLAKRKSLKGTDCVIPKDILLDVPEVIIDTLGHGTLSLLFNDNTMQTLWSISIIIAIIKHLRMTDEILSANPSDSVRKLLNGKNMTVSDNFGEILSLMTRKEFFRDLQSDYNRLINVARTINKNVAIFIDNVDECFEKSVKGLGREIWYIAQNSLVKAIYTLVRLNPKFKLFASIRKEAVSKLRQNSEMYLQYESVSLELKYHKEELKEIFIRNIKKENPNRLVDAKLLDKDPIQSFFGTDIVPHSFIKEQENLFDYLYRHTLQRPRDFMEMGREISRCPVPARKPTTETGMFKIKSLINETAAKIATTYINEVLPHLAFKDKEEFNRIFGLINANVIEREELKKKCMEFNKDHTCKTRDCKKCRGKINIFNELYKTGLLGYVEESQIEKGTYIQKFEAVGEKIFTDVGLPDSTHYLVHPVLGELIREKTAQFNRYDHINIIGYDRMWKVSKGPFKAEPPFKLDISKHQLFDKNQFPIPLNYTQHCVLRAFFIKVGRNPIGVLPDSTIAKIIAESKGKSPDDDPKEIKRDVEQFARYLRDFLKKYGIYEKDAIIKRVKGEGFSPGFAWDKRPTIYSSEVTLEPPSSF